MGTLYWWFTLQPSYLLFSTDKIIVRYRYSKHEALLVFPHLHTHSLLFFEYKNNKKHKIHKVVLHKVVYLVFIYDLQLFKSVILYPKTYVSTVIEAFVPCHQALSGNEVVDALRVVGDKMQQCRLALCQGWLQERIAIASQYYFIRR